jgi:hypothetical protein
MKFANDCVFNAQRHAVTTKEQATGVLMALIYLILLVWSIKNVVISYQKRRSKIYQFLPKIN